MSDQPREKVAPALLPAATILMVRDGLNGLEVFMVKRHHQIDFASGALVFPGGKLAAGDSDPAVLSYCDGADGMDAGLVPFAAAAIREAFEESGLLLARRAGETALLSPAEASALAPFRPKLDKGEIGLAAFLKEQGLRLALDQVARFAHWKTPVFMPKRFDTHFFIAMAPVDQMARHDGGETVDSTWITPQDAVSDPKKWTVIFPTRMNLVMLGRSKTVAEAMATARETVPVTVEPWVGESASGAKVLKIQANAGYGDVEEPLENMR
ncbi:MAG: NUDIX hydrolase [Alphaproteobacteria bacterium]|nr:NUDIX hydrolase [Alphaproteobacteria bacterium]